jgi:hypothetical protein
VEDRIELSAESMRKLARITEEMLAAMPNQVPIILAGIASGEIEVAEDWGCEDDDECPEK